MSDPTEMATPEDAETVLTDVEEVLYRQAFPGWVDDGVISSQVFRPTAKDEGQLSIARGSLTSAQGAYETYIARGFVSAGTWAVTLAEVHAASLRALSDAITDDEAHGFVDFRELGGKACDKRGALLKAVAVRRGCLFEAPPAAPRTGSDSA